MAFPQSFLDELIARSDIVDVVGSYVPLTAARAATSWGCCPFHSEKTGSVLTCSPDKQIYYCFGCKKGGGVINFIMEHGEPLLSRMRCGFWPSGPDMQVPEEDGDRDGRTLPPAGCWT